MGTARADSTVSAIERAARNTSASTRSTALDPRSADFDRAHDRAFGLVAFVMNRHLVHQMLRAQRELQIDFESIIIWGLLAHLCAAHLVPPGSSPAAVLDQQGRLRDTSSNLRPLRLRDLEQIARIPRETIRRKLARLEAKGHIERSGAGWIPKHGSVDASVTSFNRETARRMLLTAQEIARLLEEGRVLSDADDPQAARGPMAEFNVA
jgi:hypothetical protein